MLLSLLFCGCESKETPALFVNEEMQEELESRTPGSVTWIENEVGACKTHQSTKWLRSEDMHQTVCVRCGETVIPPQVHQMHSERYEGYAIIDGQIYLRCDAKCRCGFLMEQRYEPYLPREEADQ